MSKTNNKELTIELTTKCQLNCMWCSSKYGYEVELDLSNVEFILNNNKDKFSTVRFSGGEPTLYPYLNECVKMAKDLGYYVVLLTNGIKKFHSDYIDKYELGWTRESWINLTFYALECIKKGLNISINIVGVKEAYIDTAIRFAVNNNIPIHIMKLQRSGNVLNNDLLTEANITMTGNKGCIIDSKKLICPNGVSIKCSSEKSNNGCSLDIVK